MSVVIHWAKPRDSNGNLCCYDGMLMSDYRCLVTQTLATCNSCIISLCNGLPHFLRQAITWTNDGILTIRIRRTNIEIWIKISIENIVFIVSDNCSCFNALKALSNACYQFRFSKPSRWQIFFGPTLAPRWPNVDPVGSTLGQRGPNVPCYLGSCTKLDICH